MAARRKAKKKSRKVSPKAAAGLKRFQAFMKAEKKKGLTHRQALAAWKKSKPKARKAPKKAAKRSAKRGAKKAAKRPVKKAQFAAGSPTFRRAVAEIQKYAYDLARDGGATKAQSEIFAKAVLEHVRYLLNALSTAISTQKAERIARLKAAAKARVDARYEEDRERIMGGYAD